jgi:hypothetical protein
MRRSPRARTTANLSESLHQQLNMYALAATATGVGLLALSQAAEAKIVYTPAHVRLGVGAPSPLDLNKDGIIDFYFIRGYGRSGGTRILYACQFLRTYRNFYCATTNNPSNGIRVLRSDGCGAALRPGAIIRHGDRFGQDGNPMGMVKGFFSDNTSWLCPWVNGGKGVKNRYLGLKFKIKGRFHFGWARITVKTTSYDFTATMTGYAYETVPGKSIIAGKTKGSNVITMPADTVGTLGHLALGRK